MGGKDDELDEESLARVRLVTQKKRQLEDNAELAREDIRCSFDRLREALLSRERQLLRQVDVISRQRVSLVQLQSSTENCNQKQTSEEASLLADLNAETKLIERILDFGRVCLSNGAQVSDFEPYTPEDYIEAGEDLVSFDKSLKSEADELDASSVLRRRSASVRNSFASAVLSSSIVTNGAECGIVDLECKDCGAFESIAGADLSLSRDVVTETSEQCNDIPAHSEVQSSSENIECKLEEGKSNISTFIEDNSVVIEAETSSLETSERIDTKKLDTTVQNENSASKSDENCTTTSAPQKVKDGETEHPIQIQQWLRQILAETETEPIIHEIGQFTKIPNARLSGISCGNVKV
ncbi:hypothetical protein QAD02_015765 [Eretmocerus hayati]|uniref:Uncharacterized protein n=1 Tax=Eretmocerus hayati TaxID=131215 RepID=A0ACC2PA71_9HYME|nr:hypothetical protein QAD02_015765 [Eretmocerus hayati]